MRYYLLQVREEAHAVVADGVEDLDVGANCVGGAKAGDGDNKCVGLVCWHVDGEAHDLW